MIRNNNNKEMNKTVFNHVTFILIFESCDAKEGGWIIFIAVFFISTLANKCQCMTLSLFLKIIYVAACILDLTCTKVTCHSAQF